MSRSSFKLVFNLLLILKVCFLVDSTTTSKSLQKCREYKIQVYGQGVPTCNTPTDDNNQTITIDDFPHIAMVGHENNDKEYDWLCHGTLVSSRYVLTAAHCLQNPRSSASKVRLGGSSAVYSGETKSSDYDIEKLIVHPSFNRSVNYNDIGLIKLSRKVEFSENVRPICLPDSDLTSNILYQANYEATGSQIPEHRLLSRYENVLVTNEECRNYSVFESRRLRDGITDEMLCTKKVSKVSADYVSNGEAGAPIYIDQLQVPCFHVQLGVLSFGYYTFGIPSDIPDVATKVYHFSEWIETVIWADDEDV